MATSSARSNPYASPKTKKVDVRLFSMKQIGIASFLGSALAGMTLVSINNFRLGKSLLAFLSIVIGIAIFGIVFAVGMVLPLPGVIYGAVQMAASVGIAKTMFEKQYEENQAENIPNESGWVVGGVTVAWIAVIAAAIYTILTYMEIFS